MNAASPASTLAAPVLGEAEQGLLNQILGEAVNPRRRAIAKTITLLESTRADHRLRADELLNALLPHSGKSFRLGISGVPGVGKSTFIEALGLHLIGQGHRVAVLAVVLYNYFQSRANEATVEIRLVVDEFLEQLEGARTRPSAET